MCNINQCARCGRDFHECAHYEVQDETLCRHFQAPIDNSKMFSRWYKFSGRIGRLEYVLTLVGCVVLYFYMALLGGFVLGALGVEVLTEGEKYVFAIVCMIPSAYIAIAAGVKRTHDTGVSHWYSLVPLIPIFFLNIFTIVIFGAGCIYLFKDAGEDGVNAHGSNPVQPYHEQLQWDEA